MNDNLEQREEDIRERLAKLNMLPQGMEKPEPKPNFVGCGIAALVIIGIGLAVYLYVFF